MNRSMTAAGCAALAWLVAQPAMAACSLGTQPIPGVKIVAGRPMVDVKVDGKVGHFLLESGAAVNMMSSRFAATQRLTPTKVSNASVVKAPQFEFAGATLKDAPFVVEELPDADGVIGQTFLHQADVEYDLGALQGPMVKLAKATGCEGANMATIWAKDGDTFYEAALTPSANGAPFTETEVVINGVKLRGLFSSGKPYTTITEKAAAKAGVKTTDAEVKALGSVPVKTWMANFNSVIIGNEETKNAPLEIDQTNDDFYDVLIGADFFAAHHLYVANSQQKIYFTRAPGATVFKAHGPPSVGQVAGDHGAGRLQDHFSPGSSGGTTN